MEITIKTVLTQSEWEAKAEKELFFQDLRASIDGVECGEIKKKFINQWLKMMGYRINWKNYELRRLKNDGQRKPQT